ncbi:hypothetical protein QWY95_22960, partial [Halomonas neptunia]|nr:hypothetical protein [Halomonas neptunia]
SAYIPTNLISITDGQIYLDPRLFYEDQKPAVDVGKSVSRVGGKTQAPALKALSESLRLTYAQFLELEVFTRFGTMVDDRTKKTIDHGRRIRAVLAQPQFVPEPVPRQGRVAHGGRGRTGQRQMRQALAAVEVELAGDVHGERSRCGGGRAQPGQHGLRLQRVGEFHHVRGVGAGQHG